MLCPACNQPISGPGAFCPHCGARLPASAVPPAAAPYPPQAYYAPRPPRVPRHLQTLAILWFVYGAYRAVTGVFGAMFLAGVLPRAGMGAWGIPGEDNWPFHVFPFAGALVGIILAVTAVSALLALITGYGLVTRSSWGRILALIAAILALIHPISGTALGIYTLWVLAPEPSRVEYESISTPS